MFLWQSPALQKYYATGQNEITTAEITTAEYEVAHPTCMFYAETDAAGEAACSYSVALVSCARR